MMSSRLSSANTRSIDKYPYRGRHSREAEVRILYPRAAKIRTEGGGAVIADVIARGRENSVQRPQGGLSLRFII